MRMNRFSSAVLIGIALCTSGNDRSFATGNGDANANIASTATPEEAAMQSAAYKASAAAADLAQAQSLAATLPNPPPASWTPSAGKNETHHKTPRTGTSSNAKGTTR